MLLKVLNFIQPMQMLKGNNYNLFIEQMLCVQYSVCVFVSERSKPFCFIVSFIIIFVYGSLSIIYLSTPLPSKYVQQFIQQYRVLQLKQSRIINT